MIDAAIGDSVSRLGMRANLRDPLRQYPAPSVLFFGELTGAVSGIIGILR
jgi:hypothetical protein